MGLPGNGYDLLSIARVTGLGTLFSGILRAFAGIEMKKLPLRRVPQREWRMDSDPCKQGCRFPRR